jgi:DNA-binding MarR family transcriptional regulator
MVYQPHPESLDRLLIQVCRLHYARAYTLYESLGLYRGQPPVLSALWEREGLTHTELAHRLHVTPATMTRMLRRMEKAGFVERRPDPHDMRVSRVYLSSTGRSVQDAVDRVRRLLEEETFAGVGAEERALLARCFARMRQNLIRAVEDLE